MANDVTQERIRNALSGVLFPLARTLLRCGVGYSEFAEIAKRAFVDAASRDYGVRNRPTNTARVAVMTGISRKEVGRIRRVAKRDQPSRVSAVTLPAAVLNSWHSNRAYSDRSGVPKVLPFSGKAVSFSSLVRSISRDIPPGAMRRELMRGGAVREVGRNQLVAVKRHFVPDSADEKILVGLELGLRYLAETIEYNSNTERPGGGRFQRFVEGPGIRKSDLPIVKKEIESLLVRFSLAIDDHMAPFGATAIRLRRYAKQRPVRVGVGLYYFDDADDIPESGVGQQ